MKEKQRQYICNKCYNKVYSKGIIEKFSISPLTVNCEICKKQTSQYVYYDEDNSVTPCCNKEIKLKIFPDYCSSGIWCWHCGCMLNDIGNLPDGLIKLCEIWNNLYDEQIGEETGFVSDDYFGDIFISTGKYLCELINQYHYCKFEITKEEIINEVQRERRR